MAEGKMSRSFSTRWMHRHPIPASPLPSAQLGRRAELTHQWCVTSLEFDENERDRRGQPSVHQEDGNGKAE